MGSNSKILMAPDHDRLEDKLDQILAILHGDGKGEMGMVQKVSILWRLVLTWPLCTASALVGAILTLLIEKAVK